MDEFFTRATIVKERMDRLGRDARAARDPERLRAIEAEMGVCLQGMEAIREEQLVAQLPKPKRSPWWRRVRAGGGT